MPTPKNDLPMSEYCDEGPSRKMRFQHIGKNDRKRLIRLATLQAEIERLTRREDKSIRYDNVQMAEMADEMLGVAAAHLDAMTDCEELAAAVRRVQESLCQEFGL